MAYIYLPNGARPSYSISMPPNRGGSSAARAECRGRAHYRMRGQSLGLSRLGTAELIRAVQRGFSFKLLETFSAETGFAPSRIASLIQIPDRTFARRKASGRLSPEESERLLRVATIFEKAVALFEGNVSEAVEWLTKPKKALGDNDPLSYSRSELGAREVENLIGRLEHGVFT
jgi:putative toxin-antitoxin system antitoxin component (TIGR02293 family)